MAATPALAQEEGQVSSKPCPATPAPLPAELAGWQARVPLAAAGDAGALGGATLTVGKGADVALLPTPQVKFPLRPEHPGGSVSHAGLLAFTVTQAGTYRVGIGSSAWIDVVRDGKAVTSIKHGHGPDCSGIHKMVDFPLTPGAYVLEIAGNGTASLPVLVTQLP